MDPLSQATLGAGFSQATSSRHQLAKAAILGALAGMAADLDVLIRSDDDPLLALEFHRQFTHALLFIPLGGLLCNLLLYPLLAKRWGISFVSSFFFCTLGYASHGLLDACTSYGTQLLWPFSDQRFAWNTISIIDPLFTLPLIGLVILAGRYKQRFFSYSFLFFMISYQLFGLWQQHRVKDYIQHTVAEHHRIERLVVKPSFANLIVWKVVYEFEGYYYNLAIKPGFSDTKVWRGQRLKKLSLEEDLPWLDTNSQQAKDIERFRQFSNNFLAIDSTKPHTIVDVRYSTLPNNINALWGIELSPLANNSEHVVFKSFRKKESFNQLSFLLSMIFH